MGRVGDEVEKGNTGKKVELWGISPRRVSSECALLRVCGVRRRALHCRGNRSKEQQNFVPHDLAPDACVIENLPTFVARQGRLDSTLGRHRVTCHLDSHGAEPATCSKAS